MDYIIYIYIYIYIYYFFGEGSYKNNTFVDGMHETERKMPIKFGSLEYFHF